MNPVRAIRAIDNNLFASGAGLIAVVPIYLVFANALNTAASRVTPAPCVARRGLQAVRPR